MDAHVPQCAQVGGVIHRGQVRTKRHSAECLRPLASYQHALEMVVLESLVPIDHLVRKIVKAIDLEFIRERVAHLYCPTTEACTRPGGAVQMLVHRSG